MPYEKSKMIDITRDKPIKITVRVAVPVRDHPKVMKKKLFTLQLLSKMNFHPFFLQFNFVGKLLGPKGNRYTLKCFVRKNLKLTEFFL